jgi:hypothetical protein
MPSDGIRVWERPPISQLGFLAPSSRRGPTGSYLRTPRAAHAIPANPTPSSSALAGSGTTTAAR